MATNARIIATDTPRRTPVQIAIALSTTGIDLGGESGSPQRSADGFKCQCSAAWLWGDADGQAHTVAADSTFHIPSNSLSGWWAKAAAATPSLIVTALLDASETP